MISRCLKKEAAWLSGSEVPWRQRGSVVRVGNLNAEDPGSNPRLGLLNEFVLGDLRGKFTTLCKQPAGVPPTSWDY